MTSRKRLDELSDNELYELWIQHRGEHLDTPEVRRSRLAGGILAKRYSDPLQRFFRKRLGDDCQDVLSETTNALLFGNYRGEGVFRSYVFGIAYRRTLAEYKKRSRRKDFDPSVSSLNDLGGSVTYVMEKLKVRALVAAALRRVPLDNQQAIELYYIEGFSGPEAAEIIGISLSAFRWRLKRGLEKVRKEFAKIESTGGEHEGGQSVIEDWAVQLGEDGELDTDDDE